MSRTGRTHEINRAQAQTLLAKAEAFLDVADLILDDVQEIDLATVSVSASLSVLGAIAAVDALCGKRLGVRSRGQDHRQAADLLEEVEPNGRELARVLRRVLDVKDGAHYGAQWLTRERAAQTLAHARTLLDAATAAS